MPDTIRSLIELNAQFADSTTPTISPQDIRDLMVSMMVYGEIGSGAKAAITLPAGFTPLDFTLAGVVGRGLTVDTVNKWISGVPVTMKAEVSLEVQFTGANGVNYEFAVFKNPDGAPEQISRLDITERIINAAQRGAVNVSASIQLAGGDKLQAGVRANGATFTLLRGLLRVKRIGVE
jgi:hypothetical protein